MASDQIFITARWITDMSDKAETCKDRFDMKIKNEECLNVSWDHHRGDVAERNSIDVPFHKIQAMTTGM